MNLKCDCGHEFIIDEFLKEEIQAHFAKAYDYEEFTIKCYLEYQK